VVHETASTGFAHNTDRYHSSRPLYHQAVAERVLDRYGAGSLIDLGAGTGIFTRQLTDLGGRVIAIEPVFSMRETLSQYVPEADIRVGSAENIPLDDHSVDTVVAAQSFHWFRATEALDEIYRVLRPGGHLVTVWNIRDNTVRWMAELTKLIDQYRNGAPSQRDMRWRRAINADPRFGVIDEFRMANPVAANVNSVIDRVLSVSFINSLSPDKQEHIAANVREITASLGTDFDFPYESQLQAWRALPSSG